MQQRYSNQAQQDDSLHGLELNICIFQKTAICMYVFMYVCMYVCMYVYICSVSAPLLNLSCVYVSLCVCVCVCDFEQVCED